MLNTYTAVVGLRHGFASSKAVRPFVHVLGGARFDHTYGHSNTAWGGFAGGGVDIKAAERVAVRFAADFQVFYDEYDDLKMFRLGIGLTF